MSVLVEKVTAWCGADGMACAVERDDASGLALTIAAPKVLESWVTVRGEGPEPDRLTLEYRDHPTTTRSLEELIELASRVSIARSGLVEFTIDPGSPVTTVTSVRLYVDGFSQHVLMAAVGEIHKAVEHFHAELKAVEEYDGLLDDTRALLNGLEEAFAELEDQAEAE